MDVPGVSYTSEPLQLLDLRECSSVADIVKGMKQCSFGARMLGEVTEKISQWIFQETQPLIIYDGKLDSPLGQLLTKMVNRRWFARIILPQEYAEQSFPHEHVIVIGTYPERYEDEIYHRPKEVIYINNYGLAKPGQIQDGYFPNVVFSDPRFVLPTLFFALEENIGQKRTKISEYIYALEEYSGLAAEVSHGAQTLLTMIADPDCAVFLTLSGAMTIAKMGLVICDMIDLGMVQAICSTGALMAHGLIESVGLEHLKYHPNDSDMMLADRKMNRVTDTLEPETNLDHIEVIIHNLLDQYHGSESITPRLLHHMIGEHLATEYIDQRGILKSAYEHSIPVFVPAFVDSEIGNDLHVHNIYRKQGNKPIIHVDLEKDTEFLLDFASSKKKIGIFTIGGGVPRNYIQNIAPLIDVINERQKENLPLRKFAYGCRICPDPMYYGHLSGCSYSEGMSWRKMETGGRFSEIHADATLIWPFLVKYIMENHVCDNAENQ